jgi:hypothetical protein
MYVRRLTTFSRPVQVPAAVPGIQTDRSFDYRKRSRGPEMPAPGTPFEKLRESGFIVCGDPDYVTEWLAQDMQTAGYGHFLAMFRVGKNTHENVMQSKRLFAEYVMPRLRHINAPSSAAATVQQAARQSAAG